MTKINASNMSEQTYKKAQIRVTGKPKTTESTIYPDFGFSESEFIAVIESIALAFAIKYSVKPKDVMFLNIDGRHKRCSKCFRVTENLGTGKAL